MNSLPIRLFHAILSGLFIGTLLSIASLQLLQRTVAQESGDGTGGAAGETSQPPSASSPALNPTPDDLDGDGMPNAWELANSHDPDDPEDAASDFDHDGLIAAQERISGTNPLGHWTVDQHSIPNLPANIDTSGGVAIRVIDVNAEGVAALRIPIQDPASQVVRMTSWIYGVSAGLSQIAPVATDQDVEVFDINDEGVAIGRMISRLDGSIKGFTWQNGSAVDLVTPDWFMPAVAKRINNRGNWVGFELNSYGWWSPVAVIDGQVWRNQDDPGLGTSTSALFDGLSVVEMIGINENDQVLAAYTDYWNWSISLAVAWKGHVEAAGFPSPYLDSPSPWMFHEALINNWGEFAAARMSGETSYYFDGNSHEFSGNEIHGVTDDGMVAAAWGGWAAQQGVFLWADGVEVNLDSTALIGNNCRSAAVSSNGIVATADGYEPWISFARLDQDADGDGMSDDWEDHHGFNKALSSDAAADADGDGINNYGEFLLRSDPNAAPVYDPNGNAIDLRPGIDSDGDGIPNIWEWENGLDYLDSTDALLDFDRDGYTNLQEFRLNTDPRGAPSYRIHEVGPFPGASSISLSSAVLGDGVIPASYAGQSGGNVTESVFLTAKPGIAADGGQRPAVWSRLRSDSVGSFSFTPSHGSQYTYSVAQAPGGAFLSYFSGSPNQFVYWATSSSTPITLSGAPGSNDITNLYNAKLSPSGNFLVATRSLASGSGVYQPVIWKMPLSGTATFKPVRLIPPAGATLGDWSALHVNDHGHVVATGSVGGQNRPILWTINETGTAVSSSILTPLPGGSSASASGISNQSSPLVCGNSTISGNQWRATVWNASGTATDLGTLPGGSYSTAALISRGGKIAGIANVLVGNSFKYQPFLASFDPASSTWKLQAQGEPGSHQPALQSVNDSGEILGRLTEYNPVYRQLSCLWRHGRAYPLDARIPASSGYVLQGASSLNPNGSLLATTWKDGAQVSVLLTPDSDTDGDGLPDAFENQNAFNAFVKNNPATDTDTDGLNDLEEYRNGTQPRNPDTDADGMKDGWEVSWGLLPLDPTDAPLDPDGDRVTNLRESQLGTTPTGIYKVESLITDTDWINPSILSVDDSGRIIYAGQYQYGQETDEFGFQLDSYYQEHLILTPPDAAGSTQTQTLPLAQYTSRSNSDWSEYQCDYDSPTYWSDAASGMVHGAMFRSKTYNHGYGASWEETLFLIPDAANDSNESPWISWETIETNLRGTTIDNSYTDEEGNYIEDIQTLPAVIDEADTIYTNADAVSPSGIRRIHRTAMGQCLVLNESGGFVESLPGSTYWQKIDDQGWAIALTTRRIAAANGLPAYYAPELKLHSYGYLDTIPIPHEPGVSPNYSLQRFSNDGKILLSRSVRNAQLASTIQYHLFDLNTRTLTRVRQPGLGSESIASLSDRNGHLLGTGPKPFQISPDGTCIRLDALRIMNSPTESPVPFGTLYPRLLTPSQVTSNGRMTLTTTNNSGQTVVLQISPHNDGDGDSVPDDWEMDFRDQVDNIFGPNDAPADAASYDVGQDYGNTGMTAVGYYNHLMAGSQGMSDHALFGMNTLFPSTWLDTGYMYYLDKKPVKFHSFVQGAKCEGEGYYHSGDWLDLNGYGKMTHTVTADWTTDSAVKKTTMLSNEKTVSEVGVVQDFLQDTWPTDFPEYKRFWDPTYRFNLDSTETTDYKLPANAPPTEIKKVVVKSDPAEKSWQPFTSVSHNQTSEGEVPTIPTDIATTTADDAVTTTTSSILPSIDSWDVWTLFNLDIDGFLESATEWSLDYGDGTTEEYKVSEPIAWKGLSKAAYSFAQEKAKINYFATNRTTIHGQKGSYGVVGQYQKATWNVEGPEDRDHTLMIVKTYSRTESTGVNKTEKKFKILTLKAKEKITITEEADPGDEWESVEVLLDLVPMELKAFKRGTLNAPGAEVPAGTGEFGYETVMMENADSESAAASTSRDCDESGAAADLNAYRKGNDDDLVKIVLKWPAGIKPAGASLKLLHDGMQVDATQTTADAAVSTSGPSRLNFFKADGTRITNPTTDLQIADLANAPASSYLSKILTDGELTIFVEGADRFGDLPANRMDRLGGAQLRWEFTQGATTATAKLLVYRGGFLRFMQPAGAPGTVGDFEFWDGKGRVKNKVGKPIFGKEFEKDVTDYGTKLATWKAKSGKTKPTGKAYNLADKNGHTPPGWWSYFERDVSAGQDDQTTGSGNAKKIEQGGYVRWKQDDEIDSTLRYTTNYWYDASKAHDRAIGEPTKIKFKYEMVPISPSEGQNRTNIQIHPDGDKNGTAGCIGIQSYQDCKHVAKVLERFTKLKVKVQIQ